MVLRLTTVAVLAGAAVFAAGCGGHSKAPPGSPSNPLHATTSQGSETPARSDGEGNRKARDEAGKPGYQQLVEQQHSRPRSRFTPCNLVTRAQATAIIGARLIPPVEAPQGPTCIYRSRNGRQFVTLAVQNQRLGAIVRHVKNRHRIRVAHHSGVCGAYGQPVLYVPVSHGRLLTVSAQCGIARQFAAKAVGRLGG
jgi:hypothetical protein